jgi:sulfate adenylyltransferase subunit 2
MESEADTLGKVVAELARLRTSERQGRAVDREEGAGMEAKKKEGYF